MKIRIFSVYDSKAEAYLEPFYSMTVGLATRSFETAVNEEGHQFAKYAGDYTLMELGSFDQGTAGFEIHKQPINLGLASSYVKKAADAPQPMRVMGGE